MTYPKQGTLTDSADQDEMPEVLPTIRQLTFGRLESWTSFERLCLELGETASDVVEASEFGSPGQFQAGIDLKFRLKDGSYRLVQCKQIKRLRAADIVSAVDLFLDGDWANRGNEFVFAVSVSARETGVQRAVETASKRLEASGLTFRVWDRRSLSTWLKQHPVLVETHFGLNVLRWFLPQAADRSIVDQLDRRLADRLTNFGHQQPSASPAPPAQSLEEVMSATREQGWDAEVTRIVRELADSDTASASRLLGYLGTDLTRVASLLQDPPDWVVSARWELHCALGRLAFAAEHFDDARTAFLKAQSAAPTPELRASMLARASRCALALDCRVEADKYIERASKLDSESFDVRLHRARFLSDSSARLSSIRGIKAATNEQREHLLVAEIDALWNADAGSEIEQQLEVLLELNPQSFFGLDRRSALAARRQLEYGDRIPMKELLQGADDSRLLAKLNAQRGRYRDSAICLARTAQLLALAGFRDEAHEVLSSATTRHHRDRESRNVLAEATLQAGQPLRSISMLGDRSGWSDEDQLLAARAWATTGARLNDALQIARSFLDSDNESFVRIAAWVCVVVSAQDIALEWDSEAAALLAVDHPVETAVFRSERLSLEGDDEAAQRLLQEHASDTDVMRLLVDNLLASGQYLRALNLSEALVSQTQRPRDRMRVAWALHGLGRHQQLAGVLETVAASAEASEELRGRAFRALMHEIPGVDYVAREVLVARWRQALPDDLEARWQHAQVLALLTRHGEAFATIRDSAVSDADRCVLKAKLAARTQAPRVAAETIDQLIGGLDSPNEELELLFFGVAAKAELSAESSAYPRYQGFFGSFASRFPDSKRMVQLAVPDDGEGILAAIREQLDSDGNRAKRQAEATDAVAEGDLPIAVLAEMSGRPVIQVWERIVERPLAFGHPEELAQDEREARKALGNPVVWDINALAVVGSLGEAEIARAASAFPGSLVPWSSLHEADWAASTVDGREEETLIVVAEGEVASIDVESDDLYEEQRTIRNAMRLASSLAVVPDFDPENRDPFDALLETKTERTSVDAVPAALSVARRRGLALYSDDRVVRNYARSEGIPTFGTVGLLAALGVETERVGRNRLLRRGAVGLSASGDELLAQARASDYEPTGRWVAVFRDKAGWRNDLVGRINSLFHFLRLVWITEPDRLDIWTARAIDAISQGTDNDDVELIARHLLLLGLFTPRVDGVDERAWNASFFRALVAAERWFDREPFVNPLGKTIEAALEATKGQPGCSPQAIVSAIAQRLPYPLDIDVLLCYRSVRQETTTESEPGSD